MDSDAHIHICLHSLDTPDNAVASSAIYSVNQKEIFMCVDNLMPLIQSKMSAIPTEHGDRQSDTKDGNFFWNIM